MEDGVRVGGAPLNVCYHLSKMGLDSQIISMVGSDEPGRKLLKEIEALGLRTDNIGIHPTAPTSSVYVRIHSDNRVGYDIVENVAWDDIPLTDSLLSLVGQSDALVYGSLAARNPVSRQTLLNLVEKSRFNVMDINLRGDFYTWESVFELVECSDLLKINDDEVRIMGEWLGVEARPRSVSRAIFEKFDRMTSVIVTKGSRGATYYDRRGRVKVSAREVVVKNTVGSGDAFLGGFLAERLQGRPVSQAMDTAVSLSAFVAQHEGACPPYTLEDLSR